MSKDVFILDGNGNSSQVFLPVKSQNTVAVTTSSAAQALDDYSCYTLISTVDFYFKVGTSGVSVTTTTGENNTWWPAGMPLFLHTGSNTYIALKSAAAGVVSYIKHFDLTPPGV